MEIEKSVTELFIILSANLRLLSMRPLATKPILLNPILLQKSIISNISFLIVTSPPLNTTELDFCLIFLKCKNILFSIAILFRNLLGQNKQLLLQSRVTVTSLLFDLEININNYFIFRINTALLNFDYF